MVAALVLCYLDEGKWFQILLGERRRPDDAGSFKKDIIAADECVDITDDIICVHFASRNRTAGWLCVSFMSTWNKNGT